MKKLNLILILSLLFFSYCKKDKKDDTSSLLLLYSLTSSTPPCTWTERTSPLTGDFTSVKYLNNQFVAVTSGNTIATSTDGITWTARTSPITSGTSLLTTAFGNGTYVIFAVAAGNFATSTDGVTWTNRNTGRAETWVYGTYGNGLFVALSNSQSNVVGSNIMTSPDGVTWTSRTSPTSNSWKSITYANNLFVAVGTSIMTSTDGIAWTTRTAPSSSVSEWIGPAYGNGTFVSLGGSSSAMTSSDGITWSLQSTNYSRGIVDIAFGGSSFIGVSSNTVSPATVKSANGTTWTSGTAPTMATVTYGNGLFVAAGRSGKIYTSTCQ